MSGGSGGGGSGGGGSGSGGGFVPTGPLGGGGRRPGGADECDILITLPLSAVQLPNVPKVNIGDILDVDLITKRGASTVVATLQGSGLVVGSIAYRDVAALIDCLRLGNEYAAKVIAKSATSVKVQIARK